VLLYSLLLIPIIAVFVICSRNSYALESFLSNKRFQESKSGLDGAFLKSSSTYEVYTFSPELYLKLRDADLLFLKKIAFIACILNLIISLIIYILFNFSTNQFQFVQEYYHLGFYDIYLGVDGISIYFVLLTTLIMPIALMSNWNSITDNIKPYLIIMLLLETLLLAVFLVLDVLLFYIFFESILAPLFILIGLFGSSNKVRASFYFFLYTFKPKCKKAKHRRSPKALITKVVEETLQPAWLMPQGMVRSLEMNKYLFMKWVIAVLNQTNLFVKEQRVDGFSKSRNLDLVRCTLVAGKPVFGRTIRYSSYNSKFIHTDNFLINSKFVTGLVDAEGCFALGFY
jgi:hypothetical protein